MPRPTLIPEDAHAFIIEVVGEDHRPWTAMAYERERIVNELNAAPAALAITIYEWVLASPINPAPGDYTRYPVWRFIRQYPWALTYGD